MNPATPPQTAPGSPNLEHPNATLALAPTPELVAAIAEAVAAYLPNPAEPVDRDAESGRIALSKVEAAEALGVSVDHLERHVLPDLRIVRSGRLRLIPVEELRRWLSENAGRALEDSR